MNKNKGNDKKTNEKKTKNELESAIVRSVWKDLPPRAWIELKLEDYATPMAPFRELVVVGQELVALVGPDASMGEVRSSQGLASVCELGGRALVQNRRASGRVADMSPQRLATVRYAAGVMDVLDVHHGHRRWRWRRRRAS